jgi:hypothetical protein
MVPVPCPIHSNPTSTEITPAKSSAVFKLSPFFGGASLA